MSEPLNPQEAREVENLKLIEWLGRVSCGDRDAFEQIYNTAVDRIYRLAITITRSETLADEVIGDLFLQVWQQAGKYDASRGSVLAWMTTICRSRALDIIRKQKRYSEREESIDSALRIVDEGLSVTNILEEMQNDSMIHQALSVLDASSRQLLALAYFKGCSHSEIASITSMPVGTVKTRIRRAVIAIRDFVETGSDTVGVDHDKT